MSGIPLAKLGKLTRLDAGGAGVVYRISARPGLLYKQFISPRHVDVRELRTLIGRPGTMSEADRRLVDRCTAWPLDEVTNQGQCVGFTMPEAPRKFAGMINGLPKLLNLAYLTFPVKPGWEDLALPSPAQRREIIRQYLVLFQTLHRHDIVLGDISMQNLLWTIDGGPDVFAIDCDSFRIVGYRSPTRLVETPDWRDESLAPGQLTTLDSDRFKVALLVVRTLLSKNVRLREFTEDQSLHDSLEASIRDPVVEMATRALTPAARPRVEEWLRILA